MHDEAQNICYKQMANFSLLGEAELHGLSSYFLEFCGEYNTDSFGRLISYLGV